MKIAIVVPIFNRPVELKQCFESLQQAVYCDNVTIILVNDHSTDNQTLQLFNAFTIEGVPVIKYSNEINSGVCYSLLRGIDKAFEIGSDIVINLDSDAIVKRDWIGKLLSMKEKFPDSIVTGFNSINKNRNGTDRHPIISIGNNFCRKKSVGGINMCFGVIEYDKYIRPSLRSCIEQPGNWDHKTSIVCFNDINPIVCLVPSVVQHIAEKSSMGHTEEPDVACDFYDLELPSVTLIGVDCMDINRLIKAAEISTHNIKFGAVKLLSSTPSTNEWVVNCKPITSKEAYSAFIMKELINYIDTDFALIIQHDGYVLNYKAWQDSFLSHDVIGSTWGYKDNKNVGNGGFSLRSKKLLHALQDDEIKQLHPEDHHIGRTYRSYLEENHSIKFAPEEVANRFAIEAFGTGFAGANRYSGQFGFHGYQVDFSGSNLPHIPERPVVKSQLRNRHRTFH